MINKNKMKKIIIPAICLLILLNSCSKGLTPYQAAAKKQTCGKGFIK
jgi:hypothetical protein